MKMIEYIEYKDLKLAIVIRSNYKSEGIEFFTPSDYSQQLGYMNRKKGYKIKPHIHKKIKRNVESTNEVLFIKKGKVKVDFYDLNQKFIKATMLFKNDIILLISGGHGFEILQDAEIFEVKQGPYSGDKDKQIIKNLNNSK